MPYSLPKGIVSPGSESVSQGLLETLLPVWEISLPMQLSKNIILRPLSCHIQRTSWPGLPTHGIRRVFPGHLRPRRFYCHGARMYIGNLSASV